MEFKFTVTKKMIRFSNGKKVMFLSIAWISKDGQMFVVVPEQ